MIVAKNEGTTVVLTCSRCGREERVACFAGDFGFVRKVEQAIEHLRGTHSFILPEPCSGAEAA